MDSIDRFFINKGLKDRDSLFRLNSSFIQFYLENTKKNIPEIVQQNSDCDSYSALVVSNIHQSMINSPVRVQQKPVYLYAFYFRHKQLLQKQKLIKNVEKLKISSQLTAAHLLHQRWHYRSIVQTESRPQVFPWQIPKNYFPSIQNKVT